MIGYSLSAYKILWSFYSMFCMLLFFNYLGMLLVSLTPNIQVASNLAAFAYTTLNFFSGFIVPKPVSFQNIKPSATFDYFQYFQGEYWYIQSNYWLRWSFLLAVHPKVVGLVVLYMPLILDIKCYAHLAVWRCEQRNISVWRDDDCCWFCRWLLWVSPQLFGCCRCCANHLSHYYCISFCLFLWKTELPEKVEFVSMYLLIWIAQFFWIELWCHLNGDRKTVRQLISHSEPIRKGILKLPLSLSLRTKKAFTQAWNEKQLSSTCEC